MKPDQIKQDKRAREIFLRAVEIELPEARAAYLEGACQQDAPLRSRVEALLENHRRDSFLEDPAIDGPPTVISQTTISEGPGALIGRYKILEKIGEGGFGSVYVAEQREPVKRRVALKIIKLGMDTKHVVARFEAERQALALMDHPNIAKVLDGGATDTGRPYFVMELVRGVAITQYCDENHLSTTDRLDLFIKVCHAIQHAHQKGIIHRDIKPSNILVTVNDGAPVPKVIDFGIAKATQGELTDKTIYTQFQQFIGTPAYMSPEQADMTSLDIDTRSDIYALGVLLYELLVGRTPFDGKELMMSGLDEMRRTIREKEPVRPSTRLDSLIGDERTTTAKRRSADPAKLAAMLRGDVDWIVMKCLEKDRTRRYETANGLAADLKRHLNNQPVLARPPSTAYRFQKAFQRNKLAFAAAITLAFALVLGVSISAWQAVRARKAEIHAQAEADRAFREASRAGEAEKLAGEKSEIAERERTSAEASLYAAHMNLAQTELVAGNVGVASDLLDQHRPKPGRQDFRGWEWRYLWQQCQSDEEFTLGTHYERVTGVAFSPDGRLLATADVSDSGDPVGSKVLLWDFQARKLLSPPLAEDAAGSVAFSPDGKLVGFGTLHDEIRIMEVSTRTEVVRFPGRHRQLVSRALAFSADSKLVGVGDTSGSLRVFDIAMKKERWTMVAHREGVTSLAFFPDGTKLVSSSNDSSVGLWEVATGRLINTWVNRSGMVHSVAVSPDGRKIVSACGDGTIHVRSTDLTKELAVVDQLVAGFTSITFSPDGATFACGAIDHSVRIWNSDNAKELLSLKGSRDEVHSLAYSPDGRWLVTGAKDGTVKVWSTHAKPREVDFLPDSPDLQISTLSPNGRWMFELTTNRIGRVVEIPSFRERARWSVPESISNTVQIAISSDGTKSACTTKSGSVVVLDTMSGHPVKTLRVGNFPVGSVKFSRNGKVLASCDRSQLVLWDTDSFQERGRLSQPISSSGTYLSIHLAEDGKSFAVSYGDGRMAVFTDPGQKDAVVWKAHRGSISEVSFFPDGRTVATAGADARLKSWDLKTQQETIIGRGLNSCSSAAFNADASRLASGAGEGLVKIHDPARAHLLLTLKSETGYRGKVRFIEDGNTLVSLGSSGLQFWRAPSWEEISAAEKLQAR